MSDNILEAYAGSLITAVSLANDVLTLTLATGKVVKISDEGQQCCEHRHVSTDDDPQSLVGRILVGAILKEGPDEEDQYGDRHEQKFLEVQSTGGCLTIVNHNEHNGYYGGFYIKVREGEADRPPNP